MYIKLAPARIGTATVFKAADPWHENRPAAFQLDFYAMVPKGARHASPNTPANRPCLPYVPRSIYAIGFCLKV